jgi:hypothetical protein
MLQHLPGRARPGAPRDQALQHASAEQTGAGLVELVEGAGGDQPKQSLDIKTTIARRILTGCLAVWVTRCSLRLPPSTVFGRTRQVDGPQPPVSLRDQPRLPTAKINYRVEVLGRATSLVVQLASETA